jgi:hypothetical protein
MVMDFLMVMDFDGHGKMTHVNCCVFLCGIGIQKSVNIKDYRQRTLTQLQLYFPHFLLLLLHVVVVRSILKL